MAVSDDEVLPLITLRDCVELALLLPNRYVAVYGEDTTDGINEKSEKLGSLLEKHFRGAEAEKLTSLTVRNIRLAPDPSVLLWECVQCFNLTKLDLKSCDLSDLHEELQFWGVPNIRELNLDETLLRWVPTSIGRLKDLRVLSLRDNTLTTLPHTISFCSKLEELNLERNNFHVLPGVIVRIEPLHTLRRLGNRLYNSAVDLARQEGCTSMWKEAMLEADRDGVVVPLKLLAAQCVLSGGMDYWSEERVAPALCRILDLSQTEYRMCEKCCASKPRHVPGYKVQWLVDSFKGLRHIPFQHFACSYSCAKFLENNFKRIQAQLKQASDREYQECLKKHAKAAREAEIAAWSRPHRVRPDLMAEQTKYFKCSIL